MHLCRVIREHRADDGMSKMIITGVSGKVGVQMLDTMIDVILNRDFYIVAVIDCLTILIGTIGCDFCCGENR